MKDVIVLATIHFIISNCTSSTHVYFPFLDQIYIHISCIPLSSLNPLYMYLFKVTLHFHSVFFLCSIYFISIISLHFFYSISCVFCLILNFFILYFLQSILHSLWDNFILSNSICCFLQKTIFHLFASFIHI